ncbi:unnamed protein product [Ixodes hexagonus]
MASETTRKKSKEFCCVPQCSSARWKDTALSFLRFPKADEASGSPPTPTHRRRLWVTKLRIGKKVSRTMIVCSKHFHESDYFLPGVACQKRRLKRTAVPSERLPVLSTHDVHKFARAQRLRASRSERQQRRAQAAQAAQLHIRVSSKLLSSSGPICTCRSVNCENCENVPGRDEDLDHDSSFGDAVTPVEMEVAHLLATFGHTALSANSCVDKAVEVCTGDFGPRFTDILSAENINTLTGLTSMELLETLTMCAGKYYEITARHRMSLKERVVLCMMKMKHNTSTTFLSKLFGCTVTKCTDVLVKLIPILGKVLSSVVVLPSKSETLMNMPTFFDKYQNVRLVLDCTEVPVAQPKCLKCALRMYSFYKKGFTCKYMVSVTPGGLIAHISAGYGGRASDKHIFEESGVVDLLLPVIDNVMVDRGFLIDQICEDRLIKVIRPPFKKQQKQMSRTDALDTQKIASARVHVERVIQRIKIFKILSTKVAWNMVPLLDDIMMIAAGLTNLSAPILAPERFL